MPYDTCKCLSAVFEMCMKLYGVIIFHFPLSVVHFKYLHTRMSVTVHFHCSQLLCLCGMHIATFA